MTDHTFGGPIHWRMHLRSDPETVFAVLNSDEGRRAFWAESAVETEGHIDFRFINGITYRSEILVRDRPRLFVLEYFGAEARFELRSDGVGGTDLLLSHTGVTRDAWAEVHAGWLNVLFPLKAHVDHSVDLRNHDTARTWDQGYADH